MLRALDEYEIGGLQTLLGFHRALLRHRCFVEAGTCRGIVESHELAEEAERLSHQTTSVASTPDGRLRPRIISVELDGRRFDVRVLEPEPPHVAAARSRRERTPAHARSGASRDAVVSPMQGTVLDVRVGEGQTVEAGEVLCIVEAMKMENEIIAHQGGVVTGLSIVAGQAVSAGDAICVVELEDGA